MKKITQLTLLVAVGVTAAIGFLAFDGWQDGCTESAAWKTEAARLTDLGQGADALSKEQIRLLLLVEDPGFLDHGGIDLETPGNGLTTLTQALAKRLAFDEFKPGISKIRQTTYAMALEERLTKDDIITLFLNRAEMGIGPDGWMTGFYTASASIYGKPPADLTEAEFAALVAVLIAPGKLQLLNPSDELNERVTRIQKLADGKCAPSGLRDVWLQACA